MTDKELIEHAANAIGLKGEWQRDTNFVQERYRFVVSYNNQGMMTGFEWNPLREDGAALRLATRLNVNVMFIGNVVRCFRSEEDFVAVDEEIEYFFDDKQKAVRRAIVRCAAKIAKINENGEGDD